MRVVSSWMVAGALTLVLSTTAVALMNHAPTSRAPLSEPIAAHSTPTTVANTGAPTAAPPAPATVTPMPATVTYSYGGDDGESSAYGAPASGAYGDD